MKFSIATVFAVAGLFSTVYASPVAMDLPTGLEKRQTSDAGTNLDDLTLKAQTIGASIKATLDSAPKNMSPEDKDKMADQIAPQLQELQAALAAASAAMNAPTKRSDLEERTGGGRPTCPSSCLTSKTNKLVVEISITLKIVVKVLGTKCGGRVIRPILIELKGLLVCLDRLVAGLLRTVGVLLCSLLGGLGLDDLLFSLLGSLLGGLLGGVIGVGSGGRY